MISDNLERFQAFVHPISGAVRIEAFWVKVASDSPDSPPVVGALEQKIGRSYPSLMSANEAALAFPAFPAIAARFSTEPFTAIADLLDALREAQEWEEAERQAQPALNQPQPPQEPS
jgi:hypothetical protein